MTSTRSHTFQAFANHNFRLYISGQAVSQCGTWLQRTAQAWLVLDLTNSPEALGLVIAFQTLPVTFLSLFGGVIADRVPKRPFLMALMVGDTLQATILAYLTLSGRIQLWEVYVLAAMLGTLSSLESPTRLSFVSEMVDQHLVQSAVTMNSTVQNASRIVGPGIAGLIIYLWGTGACFGLNAVSFLAVLVGLALMRPSELLTPRRSRRAAMVTQLMNGLRYVAATKELLFPVAILIFLGTFAYNYQVTLPLLARYALGLDSRGFGTLNMAFGIGALASAIGVTTRIAPSRRNVMTAAFGFSVLFLTIALSTWYFATLGLLIGLGALSVIYSTLTNTSLQMQSKDAYRGRVMSVYVLLIQGTSPLGGALTGWMAAVWGIQLAIGIEASICVVAVLAGFFYARAHHLLEPRGSNPFETAALE